MKLSTYIVGIPVVLIAAIVAVANRRMTTISLDPFSPSQSALSLHMPLFILLFLTLVVGVLLGWVASSMSRLRKTRKPAPPSASAPPHKPHDSH